MAEDFKYFRLELSFCETNIAADVLFAEYLVNNSQIV